MTSALLPTENNSHSGHPSQCNIRSFLDVPPSRRLVGIQTENVHCCRHTSGGRKFTRWLARVLLGSLGGLSTGKQSWGRKYTQRRTSMLQIGPRWRFCSRPVPPPVRTSRTFTDWQTRSWEPDSPANLGHRVVSCGGRGILGKAEQDPSDSPLPCS